MGLREATVPRLRSRGRGVRGIGAKGQQRGGQMGTDEACPSRDQNNRHSRTFGLFLAEPPSAL